MNAEWYRAQRSSTAKVRGLWCSAAKTMRRPGWCLLLLAGALATLAGCTRGFEETGKHDPGVTWYDDPAHNTRCYRLTGFPHISCVQLGCPVVVQGIDPSRPGT